MAKSTYKYITFYQDDFDNYFYVKISDKSFNRIVVFTNRRRVLNSWNSKYIHVVHNGKVLIRHTATLFSHNRKLGEFSKTRKPFFFRSKKKR